MRYLCEKILLVTLGTMFLAPNIVHAQVDTTRLSSGSGQTVGTTRPEGLTQAADTTRPDGVAGVRVLDGPGLSADSVRVAPPILPVPMIESRGSVMLPLKFTFGDDDFETPEMRAARLNEMAREGVMSYIGSRFEYEKMPELPAYVMIPMALSGLFLWNDAWSAIGGYKVSYQRHGYVPLSMTTPFISAWLPGWAPYENLSGEDFFPKAVEAEFDIATGKFRQVSVDWNEYQKKLDMTRMRYNSSTAVPFKPLNAVERKVFGDHPVMP